jgi:hypothetical protein
LVTVILPPMLVTGQRAVYDFNVALTGFIGRLIVPTSLEEGVSNERFTVFMIVRSLVSLLVVATTIFLSSRPVRLSRTPPRRFDLEYGLIVMSTLMLSTQLASHGMIPMILVYALLLSYATGHPQGRTIWILCGVSFVLTPFSDIWFWFLLDLLPDIPNLLISSLSFSMFILWGLLVYLLVNFQTNEAAMTATPAAQAATAAQEKVEQGNSFN